MGPDLPYDFWKSKNFKKFRIAPNFFFALQYIKTEQKLFFEKKIVPEKNFKKKFVSGTQYGGFQSIVILTP